MTNEIVKLVAKKANISEPIAKIAVDTVLRVMKDKLPAPIGSTLDSLLGSSVASSIIKPASTKSTTAAPKSTASASKSKVTAPKTTKTITKSSKKSDNPLGDLGSIANALGGLLGKK